MTILRSLGWNAGLLGRSAAVLALLASIVCREGFASEAATLDFSDPLGGKPAPFPDERSSELLKYLGVERFHTREDQCRPDDIETPIYGGASRFEGRFIPGNARQELVSVTLAVCNQPYWYHRMYLVVFANDTPVGRIQNACNFTVMVRPDPDNPSSHLAIGTCGGSGQGYQEARATVYGYRANGFRKIHDLGFVYWDNCGAAEPGEKRFAVLTMAAGGRYSAKTYRASCENKQGEAPQFLHGGSLAKEDRP